MNPNNIEVKKLTKESIAIAAKKILLKGEALSVTDICKLAGVSRNAFYRNFENIDDVLIYYILLKWAEYCQENEVERASEEEKRNHIITFFYSEKELITAMKRQNLTYLIEKTFVSAFVPKNADGGMRYFLYAASYLVYGLVRAMIDNDFKDTPAQIIGMAELLNENNKGVTPESGEREFK